MFAPRIESTSTMPAAGALLFTAVLAFAATWAVALLIITRAAHQIEPAAGAYWFVYACVAAGGAALLHWAAGAVRVKASTILHARGRRDAALTQDLARQYVYARMRAVQAPPRTTADELRATANRLRRYGLMR